MYSGGGFGWWDTTDDRDCDEREIVEAVRRTGRLPAIAQPSTVRYGKGYVDYNRGDPVRNRLQPKPLSVSDENFDIIQSRIQADFHRLMAEDWEESMELPPAVARAAERQRIRDEEGWKITDTWSLGFSEDQKKAADIEEEREARRVARLLERLGVGEF